MPTTVPVMHAALALSMTSLATGELTPTAPAPMLEPPQGGDLEHPPSDWDGGEDWMIESPNVVPNWER